MFKLIERVWDYNGAGMLKYADWYDEGDFETAKEAIDKMPKGWDQECPTSDGEAIWLAHDFFVVDTTTGVIEATTANDEDYDDEFTRQKIRRLLHVAEPPPEEEEGWV